MDALGGFASANDLAKQLITLATGILALSITFIKDILKNNGQVITRPLKYAWFLFLFSVAFGIMEMMAITGSISEFGSNPTPHTIFDTNVRLPSFLQILTFLSGTIFLIVYGAKMLGVKANAANLPAVTGNIGGGASMTFHIYKDHKGEWWWRLKAANGDDIADSNKGYSSKQDCRSAIELVSGTSNIPVVEED